MTVRIEVFNQYYFAFLKKVKDIARNLKHTSSAENSKDPNLEYNKLLEAVKSSYASYDTSSNEYHDWFVNNSELQSAYSSWLCHVNTYKDIDEWRSAHDIKSVTLYKDISIDTIYNVIDKKHSLFYNFVILYIFSQDLSDVQFATIIQQVKDMKDTKESEINKQLLESIENENIRKMLQILMKIQQESLVTTFDASFKQLEDTSLGKLAKEIMNDINLDEIQTSLQNEGDIMKALSNPDGGLSKLLGSVSQKMIAKLASGEIKQETLLQDAMSFSSQLGNLNTNGSGGESGGGLGGLGDLGNIGSMLEQFQKMTSGVGGMAGLQEMMASMGGMAPFASAGAGAGAGPNRGNNVKTRVDSSKLNRTIQAKQLRSKLEKRKQQAKSGKENV